ncbi:hypothetical protein WJX64_04935 [Leifsonia sp. YIM 134122]|uniref:DUF7882 domain-containing protein n=1 Tax=Leifsonia stereocauli TaxID=3134136 RepID=A0ABU9W1K6_9MICO
MGSLIYGAGTTYSLDDRTLAHLRVATGARLRRHESFYLSWSVPPEHGSGRITIWVSPSIPLQFHFVSSHPLALNRTWLMALNASADSDRGMTLMSESEAEDFIRDSQALVGVGELR